jgi:ribosomal-protein-alanine N-acetyltransferase
MTGKRHSPGLVIVWEFRVYPSQRRIFEKIYGPEGEWERLFRRNEAYIRTELIRDAKTPARYLTLDFWSSRKAYQKFKVQNRKEYATIDKKCESLTVSEKCLGEFDSLGQLQAASITPKAEAPDRESGTHIRAASPEDIPAILDLERESAPAAHWPEPTYRRIFEQDTPHCLAFVIQSAATGGTLDGFIIGRISAEECELENIVVRRKNQSRGLGSALINSLAAAARQQKAKSIFLEVRESNTAARGLYEKCGFRLTGRRKAYYTNPAEDAVLYTLLL